MEYTARRSFAMRNKEELQYELDRELEEKLIEIEEK